MIIYADDTHQRPKDRKTVKSSTKPWFSHMAIDSYFQLGSVNISYNNMTERLFRKREGDHTSSSAFTGTMLLQPTLSKLRQPK